MRERVPIVALLTVAALASACGGTSARTPIHSSVVGSTTAARPIAPSLKPTSTAPAAGPAAAPSAAPDSPALRKYSKATVDAALDLAAHLAYYSVADPRLLAVESAHNQISDYADVTRYLTPRGISYLKTYISNQTSSGKDRLAAGGLALALVRLDSEQTAQETKGTKFDVPLTPREYTADVHPTVGLGQDGTTIVVTGSCQVTLPGTRNRTRYLITIRRTSFAYNIEPTASVAYPVGVFGWRSSSTVTYTRG